MLVWDPGAAQRGPVELGRHERGVGAVAVLPDGRVVTGERHGGARVLVWDPAEPGAGPVELGRHEDGVGAVAVLPDGQVVTGGDDDRVRLWDVQSNSPRTLLACSAAALATSLFPSELASSSATQRGEFHAGRYAQRHRTRPEPGNVRVTR